MKFVANRDALLRPLQLVTGVVERRHTLPVLANLLVRASEDGQVSVTGTDLEVELVARFTSIDVEQPGEATIPARKLADIWRSLPEGADVRVQTEGDRAIVRSGRSRFTLATLPATDFPEVDNQPGAVELRLERQALQRLLSSVSFSMAQQDVRYFLNGMLLEITDRHVRAVATDGHRLAMSTIVRDSAGLEAVRAIVPRKGVLELGRLLDSDESDLLLVVGENHLRASLGCFTLTSKLVDGKFPDYEKVIPRDVSRHLCGDRESLKQAFQRTAILSNEKYRGVRLGLDGETLTIRANNPEQEEAEETVAVDYTGEPMEIGFNVSYLQDVLNVLGDETVRLGVSDGNHSALIESAGDQDAVYVVMPMRL
jgi:DNA polymerase-3 subunit beta